MYILLAIVLLGVLITVHEFGHFAAARLCGIPVKEYSIGFGPKLVRGKAKSAGPVLGPAYPPGRLLHVLWRYGRRPQRRKEGASRNYNNAPVWKRMISVAAGPLMNFALVFVVAVG